jgi:hypothetical protein
LAAEFCGRKFSNTRRQSLEAITFILRWLTTNKYRIIGRLIVDLLFPRTNPQILKLLTQQNMGNSRSTGHKAKKIRSVLFLQASEF